MDDSWSFRTERGRAWVTDGYLHASGSLAGSLRSVYREKWVRNGAARRALFLFSTAGTVLWFQRVIPAARALVGDGPVTAFQWFVLAATAFVALAFARRARRSDRVPLERVRTVRRDDRAFAVEYDEDGDVRTLDVVARTEDDAAQAAEILRLKGADVVAAEDGDAGDGTEEASGEREAASIDFRERLSKKSR